MKCVYCNEELGDNPGPCPALIREAMRDAAVRVCQLLRVDDIETLAENFHYNGYDQAARDLVDAYNAYVEAREACSDAVCPGPQDVSVANGRTRKQGA